MPPRTVIAGPLRLEAKEGIVVFSRTTRAALTLLVAALLLSGSPSTAFASWSAPVTSGAIVLGYGAPYGGCTHRGVDLRADAGESVFSPVDGTITFAGAVPADGGGTCRAVTVETADGLRVSLMPLAETTVSEGSVVREGEQLGSVAAAGDSSSPDSHVHLSLRRGESYLDPSGMLAVSPSEAPETATRPPVSTAEPQRTPPATTSTVPNTALAQAAVSEPVAAPVEIGTIPEVQPARTLRMPRDARDTLPLVLHSASAASARGVRMPSGSVTPPGVLAALALSALLAVTAVFVVPRRALGRL